MPQNIFLVILCTIALPLGVAFAAQRQYIFTSFDYPGSASTGASGINTAGAEGGAYVDGVGKRHGKAKFLMPANKYLPSANFDTASVQPVLVRPIKQNTNSSVPLARNGLYDVVATRQEKK